MNCKEEFLEEIEGKEVLCAQISRDECKEYNLPVGYSREEFIDFCDSINFKYDSGYGVQELFGTIWYKDGTWSERGVYDGSEWWVYKSCPNVPCELKNRY